VTSDRDAIIERRVQIATPSFSADEFVGTPRTEVVRVPTKVPGHHDPTATVYEARNSRRMRAVCSEASSGRK
jgi:hypothetical protein